MPRNFQIEFLEDDFDIVCDVKSCVVVKQDILTLDIPSFLLER